MSRKFLVLVSFYFLWNSSAHAQFYPTQYRPPNLHWQQLSTPHFKILFPQGEDSVAWHTARILENEYPKVQQLTGGKLTNFPVILSNYNDRSNGLVTSLHFRSEIDISPIKGKALNPRTGGWLQNVVPHELTHAVQFSNLGGFGLGQLVNIFSPDLARSMHGATPSGIQEGLAVYYESESVAPGGGRGNYPFFNQQFNAVFQSPDRWSLGQMVQAPAYSRPFNRNYICGYAFTQWLQDTYGPETSRDAIDFNIRWPFLGYGVALKHATGEWPDKLYDDFEKQKKQSLSSPQKVYTPLPISLKGREVHRPKWLSDSTLVFYGSFYNKRPGFYTYDLKSKGLHRFLTTGILSDYRYNLSADKQTLFYSYNKPDITYNNAYKSTLIKIDKLQDRPHKIAPTSRLYAPTSSSDSTLLALQTNHTTPNLVEVFLNQSGRIETLFKDDERQLIAAEASPANSDSLALLMNDHGHQALWLASKTNIKNDLEKSAAVSFKEGSIFDPIWHPSGNRLLFSADFSGTFQVYEYDLASQQITQLTDAPYNAFEASYSPDGKRIAFIIQRRNERLPVVLSKDDFKNKELDQSLNQAYRKSNTIRFQVSSSADSTWKQTPYKTGFSWLKPRTFLPALNDVSGSDSYQVGVGLYSSDLLQQQAYSLELTGFENRLWYDASYQNKQFFPGFKVRAFSEPAFRSFRFVTQAGDTLGQTFLRQERSFALSVPMAFTLEQNVVSTSFYLEPEIRQSQLRFFDDNGNNSSDFSNATIGNFFGQFNYKLQQNIRDLQPNSGVVLYSEIEHYFRSEGLTLNTTGGGADLSFAKPTALRSGLFGYISPLRQWNQSLRIGLEAITQTNPVFDNQSLVSNGFSESVLPFSNNLMSFSTRYTIPLFYPDNGGFLLPLYLSSVYIVGFTNTVTDPTNRKIFDASRSVFGAGIRMRFRISNLSLDIGAGIGYERSRNNFHYFIGDF